jgi:hypothetical protein
MRVSLPVIAVKKATGDRTYLTLSDDVISMAGWLAMKVSTGMKLRHKWKVFWFKLVVRCSKKIFLLFIYLFLYVQLFF